MPKPKPRLIASAPTVDNVRSLIRGYWYLRDDFEPLVPTDDPDVYKVRNGKHPYGDASFRVVRKGNRWRFESLPVEAA